MKSKILLNKLIFKNSFRRFGGGHHHITGKVDLNKPFVDYKNSEFDNIQGFYSLTGLPSSKSNDSHSNDDHHHNHSGDGHDSHHNEDPNVIIIDGSDIKNTVNHNPFNFVYTPYMVMDTFDEINPYLHEELYGYLHRDDVRLKLIF